jgi:hypothetical protein
MRTNSPSGARPTVSENERHGLQKHGLAHRQATRYSVESFMASAAERMKSMRARRRQGGLREVRLIIPDARAAITRERIAAQVARLPPTAEQEALAWIEEVSEFDEAR